MKNVRVQPPLKGCPRQSWRRAPDCLPCVVLKENGHPEFEVRFWGSICSESRRGESSVAWLVLTWTVALDQKRPPQGQGLLTSSGVSRLLDNSKVKDIATLNAFAIAQPRSWYST